MIPLRAKGVEILSKMRPKVVDSDALVFRTKKGTPLCRRNLTNRQLVAVCEAEDSENSLALPMACQRDVGRR